MGTQRSVRLSEDSWGLLVREAQRRGIEPGVLVEQLVRDRLEPVRGDLEWALGGLAELRAGLPEIDGLALACEARGDLDRREV
jgi:hypothetical protein